VVIPEPIYLIGIRGGFRWPAGKAADECKAWRQQRFVAPISTEDLQ
jgi:hypothetical protein